MNQNEAPAFPTEADIWRVIHSHFCTPCKLPGPPCDVCPVCKVERGLKL